MTEQEGCKHLNDLLKTEIPIFKRHLQRHKWFRHIQDDNEALISFINEYGFICREMFCGYICPSKDECKLAEKYRTYDR
jgi:hypothetical protein